MVKPSKKPKRVKIETDPSAWERFEHAIDAAAKSGPMRRTKKPAPTFLVIDDKMRVAGNVRRNDDGSITADVYRNLGDYKSDHAMERAATFMTD